MEPGFYHFGPGEWASVVLAVAIVVDWAAQRYLRPPPTGHPGETARRSRAAPTLPGGVD